MTDEELRASITAATAANLELAARLEKSAAWLDRPALTAEDRAITYHQSRVKAALMSTVSREQLARLVAAFLRGS